MPGFPEEQAIFEECGAESAAYSDVDIELACLIKVWPNLSPEVKAKILVIAKEGIHGK